MIRVDSRARTRPDRAGEPLDGLVNMFDIGIVLAVGFLIAALEALNLSPLLNQKKTISANQHSIVVKPNQKIVTITPGSKRVIVKSASTVGQVYQLPNGQYVLVRKR